MKITEYKILVASSKYELSKKVMDAMTLDGWEPIGGVAISGEQFYQAVVMYDGRRLRPIKQGVKSDYLLIHGLKP